MNPLRIVYLFTFLSLACWSLTGCTQRPEFVSAPVAIPINAVESEVNTSELVDYENICHHQSGRFLVAFQERGREYFWKKGAALYTLSDAPPVTRWYAHLSYRHATEDEINAGNFLALCDL